MTQGNEFMSLIGIPTASAKEITTGADQGVKYLADGYNCKATDGNDYAFGFLKGSASSNNSMAGLFYCGVNGSQGGTDYPIGFRTMIIVT